MARLASWMMVGLLSAAGPDAHAESLLRQVSVSSARITLADVLVDRADLVAIDLGVAPSPGGTRVITRVAMVRALRAQKHSKLSSVDERELPKAVRFVRKMQTLKADRLTKLVRAALAKKLIKGITVQQVRPPSSVKVASGWRKVSLSLPKAPRRAGDWSTTATLKFEGRSGTVARVLVPLLLKVSAAAALPDLRRGDPITLVVRRGRVEVRVRGFAGTDADVGHLFPVHLRPSGRVIRAQLLSKKEALVVAGK